MKKQLTFFLILTFILGLTIIHFNNAVAQESQSPEISSISPNPAYEGDKIMISGKNFQNCNTSSISKCNA